MNLIDWLLAKRPGTVTTIDDRIEIVHDCGDSSILWLQQNSLPSWMCGDVRSFFERFDGADLFSSTFKIASIVNGRKLGDVNTVFTLDEIQRELDAYQFVLPEKTSAFMYQAGIGIYVASHGSSRIYECDTENGNVTEFESLVSIFGEWIDAVDDE